MSASEADVSSAHMLLYAFISELLISNDISRIIIDTTLIKIGNLAGKLSYFSIISLSAL